jgi:penicillin-binding protein 1A
MNEPPTSTPTPLRTPPEGDDWLVDPADAPPPPPPAKPKLKKLRMAFVLLGLGTIALISTVFGMLMAVASDLPALENQAQFEKAENSTLLADDKGGPDGEGTRIAKLTGNQNRILLKDDDISQNIKNAVIAIEDRRFYEHEGVDYRGIGRAFWQDVLQRRAAQGGSTITQQFVKNALSAQGNRSVFQKLREAATAYHMERRWTKQKILTQYLNSIYFGNGAYGVESAMRTYFGDGDTGVADPSAPPVDDATQCCAARDATPAEAALLAGMIASPSLYDPAENPGRAKARRNAVLQRMLDQGSITSDQYEEARQADPPDENQINPPSAESSQPYFSSWLTQQLVDRYRPGRVFGGGLTIHTTLNPELQAAAENAIANRLGAIGPSASLVAIENSTGEIKAMVGGSDFDERPFNLATNGHRQPGSSFKPFTLIAALNQDVSPDATFTSQKKIFPVPNSKGEKFVVNNYEDNYAGIASLRSATATSDNSVFAELGLKVGTHRISRLARRMGIRTPVSTNPAMTLGGLKEGVTPLEMAYAYSTIANKGMRISGSFAPGGRGPVGIARVQGPHLDDKNRIKRKRVFSEQVGETAQELLAGVVSGGTGKAAQIGEFAAGKTGTTENYGDAWFVGFNKELTVAVWVGYPDKLQPMETEYHGSQVAGGTFPAEIWHDFMTSWIGIREEQEAAAGKDKEEPQAPLGPVPSSPVPSAEQAPAGAPAPSDGGGGAAPEDQPNQQDNATPQQQEPQTPPQNQTPQPQPTPTPAPQPEPQPAPGAGGGAGPGPG